MVAVAAVTTDANERHPTMTRRLRMAATQGPVDEEMDVGEVAEEVVGEEVALVLLVVEADSSQTISSLMRTCIARMIENEWATHE